MPPRAAVSLIPSPLVPLLPRITPAIQLWQMYADFCSCALTCWLRVNETWGASSRAAKKRGPLQSGHSRQRGLATQKGAGMLPDTLTWFLLLRYNILLWRVCNPLTSLKNWLQDSFTAFSAHKHSLIILRFIERCHLFVLSVDS